MHLRRAQQHWALFFVYFYKIAFYRGAEASSTCTAGQFWNTTTSTCQACTGNTYCLEGQICTNSCNACPTNTKATTDKTNCDSGYCLVCPLGSYCVGADQIAGCPAGTYGASTGLVGVNACTDCDAGKYTDIVNQTSCKSCEKGKYNSIAKQIECIFCEPGKYQESVAQIQCIACGTGKYATGIGFILESSNCTLCSAGTYGVHLQAISPSNCTACVNGKYGVNPGFNSADQCTSCTKGKYGVGSGMNSEASACKNCEAGKYQEVAGQVMCIDCERGTYNELTGRDNRSDCILCPSNSYSLNLATTSKDQCKCVVGYAGLNGGSVCTDCVPGSYADDTGMDQCTNCTDQYYDRADRTTIRSAAEAACYPVPDNGYSWSGSTDFKCHAGYYKDIDSDGLYKCYACAQGKFSYKGDDFCTTCGNGTTIDTATGTIVDCRCNSGYYKTANTTNCTICEKDKYCTGEYAQPISCDSASEYTSGTGSSVFSQCWCKAGYYGENTNPLPCTPCPDNSWCPGRLASSPINGCPSYTWSSAYSDDINDCSCLAGYETTPGGQTGVACTLCPADTFCMSGTRSSCRENSKTVQGSIDQRNCSCVPGYYSDTETSPCQQCPANHYCMGGTYKQVCSTNYGTNGAVQATNGSFCVCNAGFYYRSDSVLQCHQCPANSYCGGGNVTHTGCTPNAASPAQSILRTACTCNAGYQGTAGTGSCDICPTGKYGGTPNIPTVQCLNCAKGTYGTGTGRVSSGEACMHCVAGTYNSDEGRDNIAACTLCGLGKYSVTPTAQDSGVCLNCGLGKYYTGSGSNSSGNCEICVQGKYQTVSNAGEETNCIACGKGKYSDTPQAGDSSVCLSCVRGTYSVHDVADSIATCTLCSAGTVSDAVAAQDASTCTPCAEGRYSTGTGIFAACLFCMNGTYNPGTGASSSTNCESCTTGTYATGTGLRYDSDCISCVRGKYNHHSGMTAESNCQLCGKGKYSDTDASATENDCLSCGVGKYNTNSGSNSSSYCTVCGVGKYSGTQIAVDSGTCIACVPGKYSASTGADLISTCQPCGPGSWSSYAAHECVGCAAGSVLENYVG